ncbi:Mif2/CENP-C like-domain-containing protein [Xylariomycetidae sp. FL0641]|nr:Mif2/CENP-C like-domain-containing protein [Xylariomycetidae sp. FL0641]
MAPRGPAHRRSTQAQNEHIYELGKAGRKTGLTLPVSNRRDEHGFEEIDDMFSSPEKGGADSEDEQDMEIDDGSEMGPATTRRLQRQSRPSLPRARSPVKGNMASPPRRNPASRPNSSPPRESSDGPQGSSPKQIVARKLDFSKDAQRLPVPMANGTSKVNGAKGRNAKLTNGHITSDDSPTSDDEDVPSRSKGKRRVEPEDYEEEAEEPMQMLEAPEDDMEAFEDQFDPPRSPAQEEDDEPTVKVDKAASKAKPAGRRGRKPKATAVAESEPAETSNARDAPGSNDDEPVKKRRGRPKTSPKQKEQEPASPEPEAQARPAKATKRGRPAQVPKSEAEDEDARESKRARTENKASKGKVAEPAATKEKAKPGRKRKSSGVGVESPAVQRGPPLPKSRGLTIQRELPGEMRTTRSGRASFKPLEWWKGDHVEYDAGKREVIDEKGGQRFAMRSVSGVVRAMPVDEPRRKSRRGRPAGKGKARATRASLPPVEEEDVERDDWEFETGRITGECIYWHPEYEHSPPQDDDDQIEVVEEELAIAESAIQLKDIKDATFKFAKTLTMPFFGSGIVDLPPGAEKRPKNSRKMQMVFFVHTGSVHVSVAGSEFNIGKGGMWFVPRGNYYSIVNESDRIPARIFFSQGCEVAAQPESQEL